MNTKYNKRLENDTMSLSLFQLVISLQGLCQNKIKVRENGLIVLIEKPFDLTPQKNMN